MNVGLVCFFALIYPIYSVNPSCKGTLNTHEIVRDEPRLINSVPNGKHFVVGDDYDKINIVHVYGNTPYDMGYALGKLMSEDFKKLVPEYFDYLDNHIETIIKILPPVMINIFLFLSNEISILFFCCCLDSLFQNGLLI
jgi:hypothetical protein